MNAELVVTGFFVGIFVGVSGVGGGSIMTPLLILLLKVNPLVAVGSDLLYSVPTKIYAAILHRRERTIDTNIVKTLCWGGIPGAVAGLFALLALRHYVDLVVLNALVKHAVGLALMASAIALVGSLFFPKSLERNAIAWTQALRLRVIVAGGVVGFLVALTSIGSGSITLPLIYLILPYVGLRRLIGSDIAFSALLIPVAAFGHLSMGNINMAVVGSLLVGSFPGVFIGSKLCRLLPDFWLRPAVAAVMVVAASRLI